MLSNIIVVILGLYVVLSPFLMLKFLKIGYKMGNSEKIETTKPKKPVKKRISKKQLAMINSLANIEAYNGTPVGQKEIK